MRSWIRNGTLLLALSGVSACLAAGCGASYESPAPRSGDAGGSAGGAIDGPASAGASDIAASAGAAGESLASAGAGGSQAEPIPLEQAARPMLEAYCEMAERCGQSVQYEQVPGACVAAQLAEWQAAFAGIKDEIAAGSVVYDPEAAPACVEARRTARCDDVAFPHACEAAIDGTRRVGEACERGVECVGDSFCAGCPGKCTARGKLGDPCGDGQWCALEATCQDG
ncbi:MAG TPA: hypothetical protein VGJ91_18875, partial [Polyangiaceae bacterium]